MCIYGEQCQGHCRKYFYVYISLVDKKQIQKTGFGFILTVRPSLMKTCHHLLQWFPVNTSRGWLSHCSRFSARVFSFMLMNWTEATRDYILHVSEFSSFSWVLEEAVVTQSSYALYWGFFPLWILHVIKRCWHRYVFFLVWVRSGLRGYKKKKKWRFFHIAVPHGISLVNTYLGIWKLLIKHVHRISVHCEPFRVKGFPICLHIRCLCSVSSVVP